MKTLHIVIVALLFISVTVLTSSQVYAIPYIPPPAKYFNSDIVLIGKVISSAPFSSTYTKYEIKVEQYLKNPQPQDTMTVIASGTNKTVGMTADTVFDVGQRAFLYIKQDQGNHVVWWYSHPTDSLCDPAPTASDLNFTYAKGAGLDYNPLHVGASKSNSYLYAPNQPVVIRYDAWSSQFTTKTFDVVFQVKNQTGQIIFNDTKQIELKPCIGHQIVNSTFIPKVAGTYEVDVIFDNSLTGTTVEIPPLIGIGSDIAHVSPLQQFRFGISAKDVTCKQGLQLIVKSEDGSPACVTPEHLARLAQYGWTIPNLKIIGDNDIIDNNRLSESNCGQFYTVPENRSNSNEIPVLILKQNSTGCAKITFTVNFLFNNTNDCQGCNSQMVKIGEMISIGKYNYTGNSNYFGISDIDATHMFKIESIPDVIDVSKYPIGSNFTAIFIITPLPNATGFYDHSIEKPVCNAYPLAVGYSQDQINSSDFSKGLGFMQNHPCANGPYGISSVQVSGMSYTQIKLD